MLSKRNKRVRIFVFTRLIGNNKEIFSGDNLCITWRLVGKQNSEKGTK